MLRFLMHQVKRLVVVADEDERRPVGVVTPFDILPLLTEPVPSGNGQAGGAVPAVAEKR
jgi:hypothetical protein